MNKFASASLTALAVALATPALADEASTEKDEIIVTGLRLATPLGESGTSVSVITAEDIELRGQQFALDALATTAGVTVNQNGAFGGVATLRLRGSATNQTLVLLDGVPISDPTSVNGAYDFSLLDTADIERIEILKGPQSTLWGSDAIGGVINIVTKRASRGFGGRAFVEGGSFATARSGIAIEGANETADFRLSATGITTDGISKADKANGNEETDGYDGYSFDGAGGVTLGDLRLEAKARFHTAETQIDGFNFSTRSLGDTDDKSSTDQLTAHARAEHTLLDGFLKNEASIGFTDVKRLGVFGSLNTENNGDRLVLRYQGTAEFDENTRFAFGAEREENEADGEETSIHALFAVAEVNLLDRLTLSAGIRHDEHSTFGEATTGRASAALSLTDTITLRSSWGEGFNAPSIFQLTYSSPGNPPNTDLQPETSEAFDVGLNISDLFGRASLDVAYFNRDTKNQIIFVWPVGYLNQAETEAQGVEVAGSFSFTDQISLSVDYAYIDAKDALSGLRQIRTPEHSGNATLAYRGDKLSAAVNVRYNGEEFGGQFSPGVEDWTRVDLSGGYKITNSIELYGRVENLLDTEYQHISGYGTPGLSAYGGVRLTF